MRREEKGETRIALFSSPASSSSLLSSSSPHLHQEARKRRVRHAVKRPRVPLEPGRLEPLGDRRHGKEKGKANKRERKGERKKQLSKKKKAPLMLIIQFVSHRRHDVVVEEGVFSPPSSFPLLLSFSLFPSRERHQRAASTARERV